MSDTPSLPDSTPGELSFKGSRCGRCGNLMYRIREVEEETYGLTVLRRIYVQDECMDCGCMLICIVPLH